MRNHSTPHSVRLVVPARVFPHMSASTRIIRALSRRLLSLLEVLFGTPLFIAIPENVYDVGEEKVRFARTLKKMRSLGVARALHYNDVAFPDEPFQYFARVDPYGFGTDLLSEERALWSALAENVERYLWYKSDEFYQRKKRVASSRTIGANALDLSSLAGFTERQRLEEAGLSFDENTPFGWMPACKFVSGNNLWCPIQLFSNHYWSARGKEPMLRWSVSTGLATGATKTEALCRSICEIIERDAFIINYLNKIPAPHIDLDLYARNDADLIRVLESFERHRITPYALLLPTDLDVPVVLAILVDETGKGPQISVGARADFDVRRCILTALSEALSVRLHIKKMYAAYTVPREIRHRARLMLWAQERGTEKIDFFLNGPKVEPSRVTTNSMTPDEQLQKLGTMLKKAGHDIYYTEMTPSKIRKAGFRSVSAVAPTLQPLHLHESIPYYGGKRLTSVPRDCGYTPADTLYRFPHPFP